MVSNWKRKLRTVRKEEVAGNGEKEKEEAYNCEEGRGSSKWLGRGRGSL
jgi:hypothetical protein